MIQNKSLPKQTSAPDGNSSHVNAGVNSSGPPAKHFNQAKSRRAQMLGHSVLLRPIYVNMEEMLPTSTSMKEKRERGRKSPVSKGLEPKIGTFTSGEGGAVTPDSDSNYNHGRKGVKWCPWKALTYQKIEGERLKQS